jgi:hypothetical protein
VRGGAEPRGGVADARVAVALPGHAAIDTGAEICRNFGRNGSWFIIGRARLLRDWRNVHVRCVGRVDGLEMRGHCWTGEMWACFMGMVD